MYAALLMAALATIEPDNSHWTLPCASPHRLLVEEETVAGVELPQNHAEIHTLSRLRTRRAGSAAVPSPYSLGPAGPRTHFSATEENKGLQFKHHLMHWFRVYDVDSDPDLGVSVRFEGAKHLGFLMKFVDGKPGPGAGYFTRF